MKIYDCFLFNNELDILELRLRFLNDTVDYFVLVESSRTLSNMAKPLHYELNKERFKKYHHKIIHIPVVSNDMPAWDFECYQRNSIKEGLKNCADNDLVFVSDVDEILNIKEIIRNNRIDSFKVIEISMYYYFLDLRQATSWQFNAVAPYHSLKEIDLGNRGNYNSFKTEILYNTYNNYGWHFSYLFGFNIVEYQEKVKSFSHQEFNTDYYLNYNRLTACIKLGIDLFERPIALYKDESLQPVISPYVEGTKFVGLFYQKPGIRDIGLSDIYWIYKIKIGNRIMRKLQGLLRGKS